MEKQDTSKELKQRLRDIESQVNLSACDEAADYIQYLEDGIREVIDVRLKFASDKQYGKGELKALLSDNSQDDS